MARPPRPDFLVIGAPKAGTTALHAALATHPGLYLSPVKEPNRGYLDVRENGCSAAGASASVAGSRGIETVPTFRADRPFVFVIRDDRSGALLFMGRVVDPGSGR